MIETNYNRHLCRMSDLSRHIRGNSFELNVNASVSSIYIWSRNLVAQSEASFVLTAHTKTIERDWNLRPTAHSISAILARSVLKFHILTSI